MNYKNEFIKIMQEHEEIALASMKEDIPNVRIVNFYYDIDKNILYFTTFKGGHKIDEFSKNDNVSFTTIPHQEGGNVRVIGAKVSKSSSNIDEVSDGFVTKTPSFAEMIEQADYLVLYEIRFDTAIVVLGPGSVETINL